MWGEGIPTAADRDDGMSAKCTARPIVRLARRGIGLPFPRRYETTDIFVLLAAFIKH